MKVTYLGAIVMAFVVFIARFSGAFAATPVTAGELAGKTLCMSNGDRNTFYADGRLSSNRFGNGTWAIALGGVQINAQYKIGLLPLTRRVNGAFQIKYYYGDASPYFVVGRYCH